MLRHTLLGETRRIGKHTAAVPGPGPGLLAWASVHTCAALSTAALPCPPLPPLQLMDEAFDIAANGVNPTTDRCTPAECIVTA